MSPKDHDWKTTLHQGMRGQDEIKEWLEECPTHKWEIQNVSNHGIWVSVRFYNEKEENK